MASLSMRRLSVNTALLLIVLGLAGVVWWQLQQKEQQVQGSHLLPLTIGDVTSILVERKKDGLETKLELQRNGEQWSLVQPLKIEANSVKVRQLVTLLDEKVEATYPSANKDLKAYGLEPPDLAVTFNGNKLILGSTNPVSNNRYILNQGQIQLVNETVYGLLHEDWSNFVALKLVSDTFQLKKVKLPTGFADLPQLISNWKTAEAIRVDAFDPQRITPEMQKVMLEGATQTKELVIVNLKDEIVLADTSKKLAYILPISQAAQLFPAKTGLEPVPN